MHTRSQLADSQWASLCRRKYLLISVHSSLFVCFLSLGAVRFNISHISSFLCHSLSPSYSLSYHYKMWPFFPVGFTFTLESLLFSPRCLLVLEDKVNTLGEFACRYYKSSLSLCEWGERGASGTARGQQRGLWVRRGTDGAQCSHPQSCR